MTDLVYEPEQNRFRMPTPAGDALVTIRWDGDVMVLPHAEVPSALRGTGIGAKFATAVFTEIENMGVKARPTCPFLLKVAKSEPRWQNLFGV